jgi:putative drug exporter of the RND superfamily
VIRGVVVPAFLRVAGELNWWAPPPLRWLHARIGFREAPAETGFPLPTPHLDEETQRLTPTPPPEPDTIRSTEPATVQLRQRRRYVVLDDNSRFDIDRDCLIGCAPNKSDTVQLGLRPIRIEDRTGAMSDAHAEISWANGEVVIVDRESATGVFMCIPGRRAWTRLTPWQPTRWVPGASVRIGNRILELEAPAEAARGKSASELPR